MKKVLLVGMLVTAILLGFFVACSGDDDPAEEVAKAVYKGIDSAKNTYELVIKKAGRAAEYEPAVNDDYELTLTSAAGDVKKSEGKVVGIDGGFDLMPKGSTTKFTVLIDGEEMIGIGGTVTFVDGNKIEAFVAFIVDGTPIVGDTITSGADVVYDSRIGGPKDPKKTLAAAKAVTNFGYVLSFNDGDPVAANITDFVPNSSVAVKDGKVTIKTGTPNSDLLTLITKSGLSDLIISDETVKFFPDDPGNGVIWCNSDASYGLICARDEDHLVGIMYVDKPVIVKGMDVHPEGISIIDCTMVKGWNYFFQTQVGTNKKNIIVTTSTNLPSSYKWTVIDQNYPLEFDNGGGDH